MGRIRRDGVGAAVSVIGLAVTSVVIAPGMVAAVDTDMAIDTTSIDFGEINVGNTSAPISVTLTNTGGDPFGPINIFGGAPPTAEFNASQSCQGVTLAASGTCTVSFTFSPGSPGSFNDSSSFTVSETANQSDGEDFSVSLTGVGIDASATTTTTTTTESPTTTTSPTTTSIDLLLCLNDPAIAYSGANAAVNDALQAAGFELLGEGTPGFFRRDDRPAPHNLYANTTALWPQLVSSGNAEPAFDYVAPGQDVTGTPVTFAEMWSAATTFVGTGTPSKACFCAPSSVPHTS